MSGSTASSPHRATQEGGRLSPGQTLRHWCQSTLGHYLDTSDTLDTSVYRHQLDTSPTRSDTLRHSKWRFRQMRCVGRVYQCQSCQTQTLWTLWTRPTRLETHTFHHTRAQECPLSCWECSQWARLGVLTLGLGRLAPRHPRHRLSAATQTLLTPLTLRH